MMRRGKSPIMLGEFDKPLNSGSLSPFTLK